MRPSLNHRRTVLPAPGRTMLHVTGGVSVRENGRDDPSKTGAARLAVVRPEPDQASPPGLETVPGIAADGSRMRVEQTVMDGRSTGTPAQGRPSIAAKSNSATSAPQALKMDGSTRVSGYCGCRASRPAGTGRMNLVRAPPSPRSKGPAHFRMGAQHGIDLDQMCA